MSGLKKESSRKDRVIAVVTIVLCGLLYVEAGGYPDGGAFFPKFSLGAIIVLSALILGLSLIQGKAKEPAPAPGPGTGDKGRVFRPLLIVGIFLLYLVVAPHLGFFASTGLLVYGVMLFLKIRGAKYYLFVVPGLIAALYVFFGMILKVPFPETLLP